MKISNELFHIATTISNAGGDLLIVGGAVRDWLLGIESNDIDLECYGVPFSTLTEILKPFGKIDVVGQKFSVLKLTTKAEDYDIALPRTETKIGGQHTDFEIDVDHTLDYKTAFGRRDITINAIGYRIGNGRIIDPYNGCKDLDASIIRHTTAAFADDPLRVMRIMQFVGRFQFSVVQETVHLCYSLVNEFHTLYKERVWTEFEKLLLKCELPSMGFRFLVECGWIKHFSELDALQGVQQELEWHPEGDVFEHTMYVLDAAAAIARREKLDKNDTIVLLLAALCHDLGKAVTTVQMEKKGVMRWTAPNHDKAGIPLTYSLLDKMGVPKKYHVAVVTLVSEHMAHINSVGAKGVRKLLNRLAMGETNLKMLSYVVESDMNGRPPKKGGLPECFEYFFTIEGEQPKTQRGTIKHLINGTHLSEFGYVQGREMGDELKRLYELQLDSIFNTVEVGLKLVTILN